MVRQLRTILIAAATAALLGSCLSLDVTFDLTDPDDLRLTYRYRIATDVWRLGVFDDDSPERAVPVSRRDAEETALLHEGVTLISHEVEEGSERTTVTIEYRADSPQTLAALWAGDGPGTDRLTLRDGAVTIPLGEGTGPIDEAQAELVKRLFAAEQLRIEVIAPATVTAAREESAVPSAGVTTPAGSTARYEVALGELLTREPESHLLVEWEVD